MVGNLNDVNNLLIIDLEAYMEGEKMIKFS